MTSLAGPLIAFSGSRDFDERLVVERVMRRLVKKYPLLLVRVGDARGLDLMVAQEATRWGKWPDVQKCCWPPPGSSKQERWQAAHERNGRVVRDADMLIAFYAPGPSSPGTTDCIKQAARLGIPIHTYHEGRWSTVQRPVNSSAPMTEPVAGGTIVTIEINQEQPEPEEKVETTETTETETTTETTEVTEKPAEKDEDE